VKISLAYYTDEVYSVDMVSRRYEMADSRSNVWVTVRGVTFVVSGEFHPFYASKCFEEPDEAGYFEVGSVCLMVRGEEVDVAEMLVEAVHNEIAEAAYEACK
jgi:hypothetical protein